MFLLRAGREKKVKGALAIRGGDAGTRALPCVLQRLPAVLEGLGQGYENDMGKGGCVLEEKQKEEWNGRLAAL